MALATIRLHCATKVMRSGVFKQLLPSMSRLCHLLLLFGPMGVLKGHLHSPVHLFFVCGMWHLPQMYVPHVSFDLRLVHLHPVASLPGAAEFFRLQETEKRRIFD